MDGVPDEVISGIARQLSLIAKEGS
jgi:hypothetical protein